jgi:hypothetical protein
VWEYLRTEPGGQPSADAEAWFDRQMLAPDPFAVMLTFCFATDATAFSAPQESSERSRVVCGILPGTGAPLRVSFFVCRFSSKRMKWLRQSLGG